MPVATGYIDLLGFDGDGEVYVIETKLARNPDRRTVVAQALDYGAALWTAYADPATFFATIDERLARAEVPRLLEALRNAHAGDEAAGVRTMERIGENIAKGAFRFVIPMNRIGEGLKDLVCYINENSRFTVYLVELEQYRDGDLTVVVARLFGAEARKSVGASGSPRPASSNAEEFVKDLERRTAEGELAAAEAEAVRRLLRIVTDEPARHNSAGGNGRVNVSPRFPKTGAVTEAPFTLRSDGRLMLNRPYVEDVPAWREWVTSVLTALGEKGNPRKYPEFTVADWAPHVERIVTLAEAVNRQAPT